MGEHLPTRSDEPTGTRSPVFVTTHWSVVLAARAANESSAAEALEKLCRSYWYPLYLFIRRSGADEESAQDLTQVFFV